MSQNTLERELYEGRMKLQRDQLTMQETMDNLQTQLAVEREVSRKMREIGRIQLCERLLDLPPSSPDGLLGNSLESLAKKADELERQLATR